MLIHDYFTSREYADLSPRAVKALVDLYTQFRGANNGDLCAAWTVMSKRGWTSKDQLAKALRELLDGGWITVSRQGGRRIATLYAVTWLPIDRCGGKLDVRADPKPLHSWRRPAAVIPLSRRAGRLNPHDGATNHETESFCPARRVKTA